MKSSLSRWAWSLVFGATVMTGCASHPPRPSGNLPVTTGDERPFVRDSLAPPTAAAPAFDQARQAYSAGQWENASRQFAQYRKERGPDDPLADNALFGEGLALFDQGRYNEAAQRFASLLTLWPDAETASAARINLAVCYYWTGAWDEAHRILQEASKLTSRPAELAFIAYYRSALAQRRGAYLEAALRAIDAERLGEDQSLVTMAREKVERLFHGFLSDAELESFTVSFAHKWPAKSAWEELMLRYRRTGRTEQMREATRALATFGTEEKRPGKLLADENAFIPHPKIGVALPVTGRDAETGRRMFQGAQLAANDYHELIRTLGIEMVMKGTGATPEEARMASIDLAADPSMIAILGPVTTATLGETTPIIHEYGVPTVSPAAGGEGLATASSRLFRTVFLARSEAGHLAELAVNTMGLRRLAVIYEEGERGRSLTAYFREAVTQRGGTLVGVESFDPAETDFSGQIKIIGGMSDESMRDEILALTADDETMKVETINAILARRYANKPSAPFVENYEELPLTKRNFRPGVRLHYDGVVVIGQGAKTGLLMGQLVFYNIRNLPRFVSREANGPAFLKNGERFAEGAMMVDSFFSHSTRPAVKDFVRHYRIAFREEPDRVAAQSYDATRLLMAAMARGARTRRQMTDYLTGIIDFPGVTGGLTMSPSGDVNRSPFFLTVKGGQVVEFDPALLPFPTEEASQ